MHFVWTSDAHICLPSFAQRCGAKGAMGLYSGGDRDSDYWARELLATSFSLTTIVERGSVWKVCAWQECCGPASTSAVIRRAYALSMMPDKCCSRAAAAAPYEIFITKFAG